MKNIYLVLFISITSFLACAQTNTPLDKNSIAIEGEIKGSNDVPFIAAYMNTENTISRDTIFLKDDHFNFTTNHIKEGKQTFTIYATGNDFKVTFFESRSYTYLPGSQTKIESGKYYKVNGDYKTYSTMLWTGSDYVQQKSEYNSIIKPYIIKKDSLTVLLSKFNQADFKINVSPASDEIKHQISLETSKFIENHLDYEFSLDLILMNYSKDLEKMNAYYAKISEELRYSDMGLQLKEKIEVAKKIKEGAIAPDFTLKDINGNDLKLSAFKGKVVLLDFWGDWCGPCRATHPFLIELHGKYHEQGFEILGIGNGNSVERWLQAIKTDQIGIWRHAFGSGIKDYDIFKAYNITAFPTKILINKDGVIAKIFIGDQHQEEMIIALEIELSKE